MGTTASQVSFDMESIPNDIEDTHQKKPEENLSTKVTGFFAGGKRFTFQCSFI